MTIRTSKRLDEIPGYKAGVPAGKAPEAIAAENIAQLASNESPWGPHPDVVAAIESAAGAMNRYPDPGATLLRRRIAERHDADPAAIAVSNGSCELLLAAASALCEDGDEVLYAWPSFSIYPYMAPISGAREVRVPLTDSVRARPGRDAGGDHCRDPGRRRLQPEQPDLDPHPDRADRRVRRRRP